MEWRNNDCKLTLTVSIIGGVKMSFRSNITSVITVKWYWQPADAGVLYRNSPDDNIFADWLIHWLSGKLRCPGYMSMQRRSSWCVSPCRIYDGIGFSYYLCSKPQPWKKIISPNYRLAQCHITKRSKHIFLQHIHKSTYHYHHSSGCWRWSRRVFVWVTFSGRRNHTTKKISAMSRTDKSDTF